MVLHASNYRRRQRRDYESGGTNFIGGASCLLEIFLRDVDDVASHVDLWKRLVQNGQITFTLCAKRFVGDGNIFVRERSHRRTNCRGDDVEFHHPVVHPSLGQVCVERESRRESMDRDGGWIFGRVRGFETDWRRRRAWVV